MSGRAVRLAAMVLGLVGASLYAAAAVAWAPIDSSRPVWSGTVPYAMHQAGSADLGVDQTEMIVRQGMDDWTRVACTSLRTSYSGRTATRPVGGDGQSVIGWVESGWRYESGAIGVTAPRWWRNITEADMELNGENYTWSTMSGWGSRVNAYSIVLHEGGHYYGLGHSSDSRAAMYYAYSGGISMLTTDDENGICALYPGSGSDCTTTGCPTGQVCMDGLCVREMGDGSVCAPCSSGADCSGGVCLRYPDGQGYCGRNCTSSSECGSDRCVSITGAGGQCVRFSGGVPSCTSGPSGCTSDAQCAPTERCNLATGSCEPRPSTGAPLGSECGAGSDCSSGLCFAGRCSQSCDWLEPTSCPSGYFCSGEVTGSCGGSGVCVAGGAGSRGIGEPCSSATDCASLYCASGVCSTPCIPGGAAGCPDGYACQVGAVPGCGSCQRSGTLGDPCEMNEDCTSRLCAVFEGAGVCTAYCDDASAPCPEGFSCLDAGGGVRVCAPDGGGLGDACATNADCLSGICAVEEGTTYCTRTCDAATPCPGEFACTPTDAPDVSVCRPMTRPTPASSGGGCSVPGLASAGTPAAFGLLFLGAALRRARRRR